MADTARLAGLDDRQGGPRRAAAPLHARPGPAARLLPRRPSPGQRVRVRGRHVRAHRLRRGRPPRPHPAGGGHRHPRRPRPPRREPAAGRDRARRGDVGVRAARATRASVRPPDGRARPRHRHRRPVRAAGPRRHPVAVRHPPPGGSGHPVARSRDARRDPADHLPRDLARERGDGADEPDRGGAGPRPGRHGARGAGGDAPAPAPAARSHRPDPHAHRPRRPADPQRGGRRLAADPPHAREPSPAGGRRRGLPAGHRP